MKTLMILGGSGYLGKSFLQSFIEGGLKKYNIGKIILISRNINQLKKIFKIKSKKIILKKINLVKTGYLPEADMIIHAAEPSVFIKDVKKLKTISNQSMKITKNVYKILSAQKKNISLLYMSSGAIYGPSSKKKKFKESDNIYKNKLNKLPPHKKNYALNKLNSEKLFLSLNKKHNIKIARGFTFVGKYLQRDKNYAIGNFLANALIKKDLKIKSMNSENVYRSYMDSENLLKSIMLILNDKRTLRNPIFNIGSDVEISINELANKIANLFKLKIIKPIKKTDIIDYYVPNIQKFKRHYKMKFTENLNKSIMKSIN
tara:strand:- start:257 stop:1204 length:948 start_codon:yes stop_codon:yes gene_type:complete